MKTRGKAPIERKRDAIRELVSSGKITLNGYGPIAFMNSETCDGILDARGIDPKQFETRTYTKRSRPGSSDGESVQAPTSTLSAPYSPPSHQDSLAELLASALNPWIAQKDGKTAEQAIGELRAELDAMRDKLASLTPQREVLVAKLEDGTVKSAGLTHFRFEKLLKIIRARQHAYLVGPAGSFKTSTAFQTADFLGLSAGSLSLCEQTTETAFFGFVNATGYVRTTFRECYEFGGVFVADEIDNGSANVLSALNSALENKRCSFPDGMVSRHPDFVCIATANTFGTGANATYVGRCEMDGATRDRFTFLDWPYDEVMERAICPAPFHWWFEKVRDIRRKAEKLQLRIIASPRATFKGAALLEAGFDVPDVLEMLIFKGCAESVKAKLLS
jgi:hypothetical protein